MIRTYDYILLSKEFRTSHINLKLPCLERGGNSTNHRGVLAQYLDTDIPKGNKYHLCHACENDRCSNPNHLYWGTAKENHEDGVKSGRVKTPWQNMVNKYGLDEAIEFNRKQSFTKESGSKAGKIGGKISKPPRRG